MYVVHRECFSAGNTEGKTEEWGLGRSGLGQVGIGDWGNHIYSTRVRGATLSQVKLSTRTELNVAILQNTFVHFSVPKGQNSRREREVKTSGVFLCEAHRYNNPRCGRMPPASENLNSSCRARCRGSRHVSPSSTTPLPHIRRSY